MEIESIVILLFTFSRVEKALSEKSLNGLLNQNYHLILKDLIRDNLFRQRAQIESFVKSDPSYAAKIGKLVMLIKGLTFNKKVV